MQLFEGLANLNPEKVEDGIPYLRFSDDAQAVFSAWLLAHENRLRNEEFPECLEAHLGKYPSLVPSIALILHLAEGHDGAVGFDGTMETESRRMR